jgi:PAS domain S-box-containing protein
MGAGDDKESSLLRDLTGLPGSRSLADFLEVAFDAVVTFNVQEQITSWNPAAEKMFGWTAQEALGKNAAELFWPVDVPLENEDKTQRQTRLKRGETLQGELTPCRKDGSSFPAQFTARAIFDSNGEICGYLSVYRDLSDKLQAREKEVQLQQSNQRLNQILASIQDDFYVLNRNWEFVFASRTFTSRIGKEPEDFVGKNIWEMFPNHVGGTLYANFHIAMEKREVQRFEIPGRYTNAWYRMTAFPSEEGITVIGTDITERKKAEDALRTSEQRLQRVLETDAVGVLFFDAAGTLIQANDVFLNMTGYTRKQLAQRELTWQSMTPPEWIKESEAQIERFALTGRIGPYEKEYLKADGSRCWMLFAGRDLGDGTIAEYCIDITERKLAEEERQKAERRYHIVGEVIPFGVWESDVEGNATYLSPLFLELTGQTLEEHRQSWQELIQADEANNLVQAWRECVKSGSLWDREFQVLGKDENYHAIHARGLPLYDPAGRLTSYVGINFDITEHKRVEKALRESEKQLQVLNESLELKIEEKTSEVRRLAADLVIAVQRERHRISHILHDDLQQRIYAIQMQLTFLRNELNKVNEAAQNEALDIEKQLNEVLEITRNLSIDLSPPILQDEGLTQAISWLASQMRQRYGLPIEVQADGPFIVPNEELQVLLFNCVRELLFNVVKHAGATRAMVVLQWLDDGLRIEVRDDGKGFPAKLEEKQIAGEMSEEENFQLSFGLPTLRHQLSLFNSQMEIQSEPGAGTHVNIIVPIAKTV